MSTCPDLESLFEGLLSADPGVLEHLGECPACAGLAEEHRQLEKDLYRLADPLPPPGFVSRVMARVAEEPASARTELKAGFTIVAGAVALAVASFLLGHGRMGALGVSTARSALQVTAGCEALAKAMGATWHTAAGPMAVVLTGLLLVTLVGLKKLSVRHHGASGLVKVS